MKEMAEEVDPAEPAWRRWLGKAWILVLILAIAGGIFIQVRQEQALRERLLPARAAAPQFDVERLGGGRVKLSELRGQVVLVDFWASWCPPCREELPSLMKLAAEYAPKGVALVAMDQLESDSRAAVGVFLSREQIQPPANAQVAFGTDDVFELYRIEALPTLYVLDREGRISDVHRGFWEEPSVRSAIENALGR